MEIGQLEHTLEQLEYTSKLFIKMLRNHPELCPHDLVFWRSYPDTRDEKSGVTCEYHCSICGKEIIKFVPKET